LHDVYEGGAIVDVGAWPGDMACVLASLGLPVRVVDRDPDRKTEKVFDPASGAYRIGGETSLAAKCLRYGIDVTRCDIEREPLPLADASVDLLLCTEVIAHLRVALLHVLREFRRVLTPRGRLLLTTPHLLSLTNRLNFVLGRSRFEGLSTPYEALEAEERLGHGGMYRIFSLDEMTELLSQTGFRVIYAGYRHFVPAADRTSRWSLYRLRTTVAERIARTVKPFGNALFLVAAVESRP
jgi:SAM-dependent methyltransferase